MIALIMTTTDAVASSFGVEYDSTGGLGINYNSAHDFASRLRSDGWTQKFMWGDDSAWEKDFKDVSRPGGQDNYYADTVDIVFWEGHGSPDSLYVPPPDDHYVTYDDAIWGNLNLEWIIAHSCSVLADEHLADWAYKACGQGGAHGMCSHKTSVNACNAGDRMAQLLVAGWTFKDAWFQQHIEKQYTGCTARVICTDATKNDKLWNHGGMAADPKPGDLWYVWTVTK